MDLFTLIGTLTVLIERATQVLKPKFAKLNTIYLSMVVGVLLGIPAGFLLPNAGYLVNEGYLLLGAVGAGMGLALSLPANLVHDIWGLVKGIIPVSKPTQTVIDAAIESKPAVPPAA